MKQNPLYCQHPYVLFVQAIVVVWCLLRQFTISNQLQHSEGVTKLFRLPESFNPRQSEAVGIFCYLNILAQTV